MASGQAKLAHILADRAQTAAGEEPWPGARVVAASRVDGRLVARLLRYDD